MFTTSATAVTLAITSAAIGHEPFLLRTRNTLHSSARRRRTLAVPRLVVPTMCAADHTKQWRCPQSPFSTTMRSGAAFKRSKSSHLLPRSSFPRSWRRPKRVHRGAVLCRVCPGLKRGGSSDNIAAIPLEVPAKLEAGDNDCDICHR